KGRDPRQQPLERDSPRSISQRAAFERGRTARTAKKISAKRGSLPIPAGLSQEIPSLAQKKALSRYVPKHASLFLLSRNNRWRSQSSELGPFECLGSTVPLGRKHAPPQSRREQRTIDILDIAHSLAPSPSAGTGPTSSKQFHIDR